MIALGVYSHFSLMWGTASPLDLVRRAKQLGYTHLALTDRDNLYGLWPFLNACEREGVTPIVGADLTDPAAPQHALVLAENSAGYRNLCRLVTQRHLEPDFRLAPAAVRQREGLRFLADDPKLLQELATAGVSAGAAMLGRPDARTAALHQTSRRLQIPLVAALASVFLQPDDYALHQLLRAIAGNTVLSKLRPEELAARHAYLPSAEEYCRRFAAYPEALEAAETLARECGFTGPDRATVLPPWQGASGQPADVLLRQAAFAGAQKRYGEDLSEAVVNRLEHELAMIAQKEFSSYFLVVRDIIQRSPRICGRGSGAASLVAYCLGITNVCPLKHNLYFERFLNPGRSDPPDIDIDFAWDERDGVLQSVLQQYAGHAAMVCNHVGFQPRMAIREVAKVFGLTDQEIGRVSKKLPWFWHDDGESSLQDRLEVLPKLKRVEFPPPWPEILGLAEKLMGTPRHLSVHSGGVVITPRPLADYVPVERAPKGVPVVQWEKDGTEESGLVKIDLLGNRSLAVIRDAVANVRANGIAFDESRWEPEDDPATREAVAAGRTMGCFYIESPAMRLLQQKAGRGDFEHLVIHSSIIRPAANDYIREYVRRLKGGAWKPLHPLLEHVLDEAFGIMVYQEDVSKTAEAVAGFSASEADGLRKILTKKDRALKLRDYQDRFLAGGRQRGVTEEQLREIWAMMLSFDGYSFCKAHSASYARVSFQAAYLKVHYPAEFMAAVVSNQGGFYSAFAYVSEARRLGLAVLRPDVNRSGIRWQGRGRAVQVGLFSIRDLQAETQQRIVAERGQQPFSHFEEFLDRVKPDPEESRALIHSGACSSLALGQDPAALLWALSSWHQRRMKSAATPTLFPEPLAVPPRIPAGPAVERLRQEFKALGFLTSRHPMTLFAPMLARFTLVKIKDLARHTGRRIRIAGWLITGKVVPTKHGDSMEFITFEDETGIMETTFFPEAYRKFCDQLDWNRPFLLAGKVEEEFGAVTLVVEEAARLGENGGRT